MPDWESMRQDLLRLAKQRNCRRTAWSPNIPCEWNPWQVWDPRYEMYFTDESAWNYIMELLEAKHPFAVSELEKPARACAFETSIVLAANRPKLYIKIQAMGGRVWGRSFHNSTKGKT